mgnify:CR=1 FL=1
MNPLGTYLSEPSLEGFGLLGGDGLDDAEHAFQIGEVLFLRASWGSYRKGVDNLSPPFGEFRVAATHLGKVIFGILRISEDHDDIFDREIPFLLALYPYRPDFLVLKQLYFLYIRHFPYSFVVTKLANNQDPCKP